MKKLVWVAMVVLLPAGIITAQEPGDTLWTSHFPNMAHLRDVTACPDGNYVVIGTSVGMYIRKISADGADVWTAEYTEAGSSEGMSALVDEAGNIYAVGHTGGSPDLLVVKYNSSGQQQWAQTYDSGQSDESRAAILDSNGHIVVTGYSVETNLVDTDVVLWSVDAAGNDVFSRVYPAAESQVGQGLVETIGMDGYMIGGRSNESGSWDFLAIRTDASGILDWVETYGTAADELGLSLCHGADETYAIGGRRGSIIDSDAMILAFDDTGAAVDTIFVDNGGGWNQVNDIVLSSDGSYAVAGLYQGPLTDYDVWIAEITTEGDVNWSAHYGHPDLGDPALALLELVGGGYMLAGQLRVGFVNSYAWLLRIYDEPGGDVVVLSPNGGETAYTNMPLDVSWYAPADPSATGCVVDISYDNGASWETAAVTAPETSQTVIYPDSTPASDVLVSVALTAGATILSSDTSDAAFEVLDAMHDFTLPEGRILFGMSVQNGGNVDSLLMDDFGEPVTAFTWVDGEGYQAADALEQTAGYWLTVPDELTADLGGLFAQETVIIPLATGWNLFANPFDQPVARDDLRVGGNSLSEMEELGLMNNVITVWSGDSTGYVEVDTLQPWQGCWIMSNAEDLGLELLLPAMRGGSGNGPAELDNTIEDWYVVIEGRSQGCADGLTRLGVNPDAGDGYDVAFDYPEPPAPPAPPGGISLYFQCEGYNAEFDDRFNRDIREPLSRGDREIWELTVETTDPGDVTLSWPGIFNTIPEEETYGFTLVHPADTDSVNMLQQESYSYVGTGLDVFEILVSADGNEIENDPAGRPLDWSLSPGVPNPFNSFTTVELSLPSPGHLDVEIFDLLGRRTATLAQGRYDAGVHRFLFHAEGRASGVYFLRATTPGRETLVRRLTLTR
ncbi:T9SS type A sorting domain-containing protein [bacterium]|nr:T9SS type A sorting domain-containing protein [bacterium]